MKTTMLKTTALILCALPALALSPQPAKDFTVTEPSGNQIRLASLKGKVVVCEFLYTTCQHCQATAQMITRLQKEYGPKGFQAVGVPFNEEADGHPDVVRRFVEQFSIGFPVGLAPRSEVLGYLGMSVMQRWAVPQIMVIDRKGMVREKTDPIPNGNLQSEGYLRGLIETLLTEPRP